MAFIEYVRVRDNDTGHEYDVVDTAVDAKNQTVLKDYPPNEVGIPRPPKHRTTKAGQSATAASPARKRAARKPSTTKATTPAATTKEK